MLVECCSSAFIDDVRSTSTLMTEFTIPLPFSTLNLSTLSTYVRPNSDFTADHNFAEPFPILIHMVTENTSLPRQVTSSSQPVKGAVSLFESRQQDDEGTMRMFAGCDSTHSLIGHGTQITSVDTWASHFRSFWIAEDS